jgi:hypothetical protein
VLVISSYFETGASKKFIYELGRKFHRLVYLTSVGDPDLHQSDTLDPDPDPHQFADGNAKCMEYEPISRF